MKKRATALLLVLLMVVSLLPAMGSVALAEGETTYRLLTTELKAGDRFVIANGNSTNIRIYSSTENGNKRSVDAVDGVITTDPESVEFEAVSAEGNAFNLKLDDLYLNYQSRKLSLSDATNRPWTYDPEKNELTCQGSSDTYYLSYASGAFTASTSSASVYIFVKDSGGTEPVDVEGVTLDKTELTLRAGENATLKATVSPSNASNKAVTWSSSNAEAATVDAGGKVTAVAEGSAVITVTTEDGGKTATCTVTVTKAAEKTTYRLTDTLEAEKNYLIVSGNTVGNAYILNHDGENAKTTAAEITDVDGIPSILSNLSTAVFTSSAITNGFSLKNGDYYVTVEGAGDLTFGTTASTKYWNYSGNKLSNASSSATRYLTFSSGEFKGYYSQSDPNPSDIYLFVEAEAADPVAVTGVTLNKSEMALTVGGSGTLTATVEPANATNKGVTWKSSKEDVATVDDSGKVTAIETGEAVITVTTADGNKTATCAVTVTEAQEMGASVTELMKLKDSAVWLIQVKEAADQGITYKGDAMLWSSRYEAYVIIVESETEPVPAAEDFAIAGDPSVAVEYPESVNDANGSKKTDMSDVQFIYNLYKGKYETLKDAGELTKVLGADVNGDGRIDSSDVAKVLTALRGTEA